VNIGIKDIAYCLPENIVTNQDLQEENPAWDMQLLEARTGVIKRHIVREDETTLDMAIKACRNLLSKREGFRNEINGLIFCTQSQDHIIPSNSFIVHKELQLQENVFAFDFNMACSGYIYGLALTQGLIQSGFADHILLITGDTYSKYIHRKDRSARVLFGDAAAVTRIGAESPDKGVIDILCETSGKHYDKFIIPAGGCRNPTSAETSIPMKDKSGNVRTAENIFMDGMGVLGFINTHVPKQIRKILERNGLTLDEIDLFVFHQSSKISLDSLERLLGIDHDKVFRNIREIGNTVSASIPIAIKDAMVNGKIESGHTVLISGFGAGLSWGTAIVRF
jgi:3-oxoacyl-[acyl-carrier-protein] synthase III